MSIVMHYSDGKGNERFEEMPTEWGEGFRYGHLMIDLPDRLGPYVPVVDNHALFRREDKPDMWLRIGFRHLDKEGLLELADSFEGAARQIRDSLV